VGWSIDNLDAYDVAVVEDRVDCYWGILVGNYVVGVGDRLVGAE
jgi:hypothetical protein